MTDEKDNLKRIDAVLLLIRDERIAQDHEWGAVTIHGHSPYVWMMLIQRQLGQVAAEVIAMKNAPGNNHEANWQAARHNLIQAAAVMAAFIEDVDLFVEHMETDGD